MSHFFFCVFFVSVKKTFFPYWSNLSSVCPVFTSYLLFFSSVFSTISPLPFYFFHFSQLVSLNQEQNSSFSVFSCSLLFILVVFLLFHLFISLTFVQASRGSLPLLPSVTSQSRVSKNRQRYKLIFLTIIPILEIKLTSDPRCSLRNLASSLVASVR